MPTLRLVALAVAAAAAGCSTSAHIVPCGADTDCPVGQLCRTGACVPGLCPTLAPTFDSINANLLQVSCGATQDGCHSTRGASDTGNLLDFSRDPYHALLGTDGTGAFAANPMGSDKTLRRVVPGDPDHSFLVIKLSIMSDPRWGSGMPYGSPGILCDDAKSAIRRWIAAGAPAMGGPDGALLGDGGALDGAGQGGGDAALDGSAAVDGAGGDAAGAGDAAAAGDAALSDGAADGGSGG